MSEYRIIIPVLNANDPSMTIEDISVKSLDLVRKGDTLFSIASSKAVEDIVSEQDGHIVHSLDNGQSVSPADHIASIFSTKEEALSNSTKFQKQTKDDGEKIKATRKAKELAEKNQVNLRSIDKTGIITEKDVQEYIEKNRGENGNQ